MLESTLQYRFRYSFMIILLFGNMFTVVLMHLLLTLILIVTSSAAHITLLLVMCGSVNEFVFCYEISIIVSETIVKENYLANFGF